MLVRLPSQTINLALVRVFLERDGRLELVFASDGAVTALEGYEADAVRAWLRLNSLDLTIIPPAVDEFGAHRPADESPGPKPHRAEEGA